PPDFPLVAVKYDGAIGKTIGTLAAFQQKPLTTRRQRQLILQAFHFAPGHQRRQAPQRGQHPFHRRRVGIQRLVTGDSGLPACGVPVFDSAIAHAPILPQTRLYGRAKWHGGAEIGTICGFPTHLWRQTPIFADGDNAMSIDVAKLLKELGLGASNQGAWSAVSGWLAGKAGRLDSCNPATAEVIASVQLADATEYDQVIREAQQA